MARRTTINKAPLQYRLVVNAVLILIALTMIIPVWNTVSLSFTSNLESYDNRFRLWPEVFSFQGYRTLFAVVKIWRPLFNTILVTAVGTFLHVAVNAMAGFTLTRDRFPGKRALVLLFLIPMMIPGESIVIPRYLVMRSFGLIDSLGSVMVNAVASTFAIFLMRNYFMSIPRSIEESAYMDGAGLGTVFALMYVPLSTAGLATIMLIEVVGKWNTLFSAVLYITSPEKYLLQQALKAVVVNGEAQWAGAQTIANNAQAAGVIIALLPMLLLYPFVQRYFIKGAMLGSIKE